MLLLRALIFSSNDMSILGKNYSHINKTKHSGVENFFNLLSCHISEKCISVYWGCYNKVPQTGRLKQQKGIVSQFWRLEIQDKSIDRIGCFCGLWGRMWPSSILMVCWPSLHSLASRFLTLISAFVFSCHSSFALVSVRIHVILD